MFIVNNLLMLQLIMLKLIQNTSNRPKELCNFTQSTCCLLNIDKKFTFPNFVSATDSSVFAYRLSLLRNVYQTIVTVDTHIDLHIK